MCDMPTSNSSRSKAAGRLNHIAAGVLQPSRSVPSSAVSECAGAAAPQLDAGEFELIECRISDVHEALLRGSLTCVHLVTAYLHRIKKVRPSLYILH